MSTLTWDHYCGGGSGAGREWSSCWSRPGPSRALPKNSDGVRMYERMHHTTLFYKLKVLWQNQAVGLVLLLHHILVGGGASWEEGGFRRCLSWVVFQKIYRASVTRMRVSFLPFLKQLIIYATCCLLPACLSDGMSDAVYMRIVSLLANEALVSAADRRTYEKMKWLDFQRPKLGIRSAYKVVSEHDWFHTQN